MKRLIKKFEQLAVLLLWMLSIALIGFSAYANYRVCRGYFPGVSLPVCLMANRLSLVTEGRSP